MKKNIIVISIVLVSLLLVASYSMYTTSPKMKFNKQKNATLESLCHARELAQQYHDNLVKLVQLKDSDPSQIAPPENVIRLDKQITSVKSSHIDDYKMANVMSLEMMQIVAEQEVAIYTQELNELREAIEKQNQRVDPTMSGD